MSEEQPHDTLFKQAMRRPELAASELRVALGSELAARIDWSTLRLVAEAPGEPLAAQQRAPDLLFVAKRARGEDGGGDDDLAEGERMDDDRDEVLIHLLFEHQSRSSPIMPLRLLQYMVDAWTRWEKDNRARGGSRPPLPPILPVVLSHDRQGWRGPKRLLELCRLPPEDEAMFGRFVPAFDYLVDDLARVSHAELLSQRALEPEARLVLWVLRDGREGQGISAFPDVFFGLLQQIAARPAHRDLVDAMFVYLRIVTPESAAADLAALARTASRKYPEGARIAMNSLQKLYEQGRQEGLQAGKATTLRLQLETRFGALTESQLARIEALDVAALDEALLRIFAAHSVEAVIG